MTWRLAAERVVLATSPRRPSRTARILAYHSIGTPSWGVNDVHPRDFERQLQLAVDDGWRFGTPADVLAEPDQPILAVTFDDGVRSVLTHAAPVLRHNGIPATVFVVSGWADGRHPQGLDHVLDWKGVEALQAQGITIGSHSVSHPDFGRIDTTQIAPELERSREHLRARLGTEIDEFAIPFGQSANWTAEAQRGAEEAGYRAVYAQAVETRPPGTIPRTFITRIDRPWVFKAALAGAFDRWEEWY